MNFGKILRWAYRHNPRGVDCKMTPIVVGFDMLKAHSIGNTFNLIHLAYVVAYGWIVGNLLTIGFKVTKVHRVKTY